MIWVFAPQFAKLRSRPVATRVRGMVVMPCNFQVVRAAAAGLNRQLQPSIRKSTPRRRLEADDYHAISSSATATITTTAAIKISVPLLDMRHIVRHLYVDGPAVPNLFHQRRRSSTIRPAV